MSNLTIGLTMIVAGILCLAIFLLPSIIAFKRNHHYKFIILAINLILGVTGVGYLIALIWAIWPQKTALVDVVTNDLTSTQNNPALYRQRGENAREYDSARYGNVQKQQSNDHYAPTVQSAAILQQSIIGDQQVKVCPYCGEQIAAKAVKCKHCQTILTDQNVRQPSAQPASGIDKSQALEEFVLAFHSKHRLTHPATKKGLFGKSHHSYVYGGHEITSDVLKSHDDHLDGFNPNAEKPLLVVNRPSGLTGMAGGIVFTNRALYYKLSGGGMIEFAKACPKGRLDISSIKSIVVGDSDCGYGGVYNGHELFLNGQKLGILRMGLDLAWDDETLEYTTELFKILTETLFSR